MNSRDLAEVREQQNELTFFNPALFELAERIGEYLSSCRAIVPKDLLGKKAECVGIALSALEWRMNPYQVASKAVVIQGKLSYEAQLVAAVINARAPIKAPLDYREIGPWNKIVGKFEIRERKDPQTGRVIRSPVATWDKSLEPLCKVVVSGTFHGETRPRQLEISLAQAGVRLSTLWIYDPVQQLCYLGTKRWSSRYCPHVGMGVYTSDEMRSATMEPAERDMGTIEVVDESETVDRTQVEPEPEVYADDLMAKMEAAETLEELQALGAKASFLPMAEKEKARELFVSKQKRLQAGDAKPDRDREPVHLADVMSKIMESTTPEQFDGCEELAKQLYRKRSRQTALDALSARRDEFREKAEQAEREQEETASADSEDEPGVYVDPNGERFDPALHEHGDDGVPHVDKGGYLIAKAPPTAETYLGKKLGPRGDTSGFSSQPGDGWPETLPGADKEANLRRTAAGTPPKREEDQDPIPWDD